MQNFLKETEDKLRNEESDAGYQDRRKMMTDFEVLGLRLPIVKAADKSGFSFYEKSDREILEIWDYIWENADVFEVMYLPLYYYRRERDLLNLHHWSVMKGWIERVDNWDHADALCKLYSYIFENFQNELLPVYKKWNQSENPWKRRASVTGTIHYASKNRRPISADVVLDLAEPLINDEDDYVQKGTGWQLRECYNLYPERAFDFLKKHAQDMAPTVYSYATEKLSDKEKAEIKRLRG